MKKSFFVLFLVGTVASSFAQVSTLMPLILGDTIANTGTVTKTLPRITDAPSGVALFTVLNKISGTGAGTAQLQVSLDGTNYVNSGSAFTITNVTTQATVFTVPAPVFEYVRVLFTGSGTESVQVRMYYRKTRYQLSP